MDNNPRLLLLDHHPRLLVDIHWGSWGIILLLGIHTRGLSNEKQ